MTKLKKLHYQLLQLALSKGAMSKEVTKSGYQYEVSFILNNNDYINASRIFRKIIGYWTKNGVTGWLDHKPVYVKYYSPKTGDKIILRSDGDIYICLTHRENQPPDAPKIDSIYINTSYADIPTQLYHSIGGVSFFILSSFICSLFIE